MGVFSQESCIHTVYSCGMSTTNSQLFGEVMPLFIVSTVSTVSAPGPLLRLDMQPLRGNKRQVGLISNFFPTSRGGSMCRFRGIHGFKDIVNFQRPKLKKLIVDTPQSCDEFQLLHPQNQKSTTKLAAIKVPTSGLSQIKIWKHLKF